MARKKKARRKVSGKKKATRQSADRKHYFKSATKPSKRRSGNITTAQAMRNIARWNRSGKTPTFRGLEESLGGERYYELPKTAPRVIIPRSKVASYLKAKPLQRMSAGDVRKAVMKKLALGDLSMAKHMGEYEDLGALNEPLGFAETTKEFFSADSLKTVGWVTAGALAPELVRRQVIGRFFPKINEMAAGQAGNAVDFAVGLLTALSLEQFKVLRTEHALAFMTGVASASAAKAVKMTGWLGETPISEAISDVLASLPDGYGDDGETDENVGIITRAGSAMRTYETETPPQRTYEKSAPSRFERVGPSRMSDTVSTMDEDSTDDYDDFEESVEGF